MGRNGTNVGANDLLLNPEQVAERLNVSVDWVCDQSSRKILAYRWFAWVVAREAEWSEAQGSPKGANNESCR